MRKVLLDENMPMDVKNLFPNCRVIHIDESPWKGYENGKLLKILKEEKFDTWISADKNISHQQNLKNLPCGLIFVPMDLAEILPLLPKIRYLIHSLTPGQFADLSTSQKKSRSR